MNTCIALQELTHTNPLAYFSHLVPVFLSAVLSVYLLKESKMSFLAKVFALFVAAFDVWLLIDLFVWVGSNYSVINFLWSFFDYINILFFLFGLYFFAVYIFKKDVESIYKWLALLVIAPALVQVITGNSIHEFNQAVCESSNDAFLNTYKNTVEALVILFIAFFGIRGFIREKEMSVRKGILSITSAVLLFFITFALTDYLSVSSDYYEYGLYGLFVLPVFLALVVYSITAFRAFNVRLIGAQALVITLVVLVASKLFTAENGGNRTITVISLLFISVFGYFLMRSIKTEAEARERIEKLADQLEQAAHTLDAANSGQKNLIHVMNHQIKGYLGVNRNIFAELLQTTDYGEMPEAAKPLLAKGLESTAAGVEYVQSILVGSSAADGTLRYNMKVMDVKELCERLIPQQREIAEHADLSFEANIEDGNYRIMGDATQLEEAFKNLITNAIKYNSPHGLILVRLAREPEKIVFSVKDSGVGISEEDKPRLFTAGGRGKDSIQYNTDSSGFGLAFVKGVVETHKGVVSYKSNNPEKGTTFVAEIPAAKN
jgi:signal transduction histidine kinase